MLVSHVGRYDRLPQRVVTDLDCHSLGNRTALPIGNGNGQMIGQFLLRITIQNDEVHYIGGAEVLPPPLAIASFSSSEAFSSRFSASGS